MATKAIAQLQGYDAFVKALKKMPDKVKKREITKLQRSALRPTLKAARQIAQGTGTKARSHDRGPGTLSKSIGFYTLKSKNPVGVTLGVQRRLKRRYRGFHWHLFAHGTVDRKIKTQGGIQVSLNGKLVTITRTGVMPANPYMEKAFNQTRTGLTKRHAASIERMLHRNTKKMLATV